jgi:predicted esterase
MTWRDLTPDNGPSSGDNVFMTRRCFAAAASGLLTGCAFTQSDRVSAASAARLLARPGNEVSGSEPGLHPLGLRPKRDALLYVPESANPAEPAPLLVYLHGATGSEQQGIRRYSSLADEFGFLLLSPASQEGTWDAMEGGYGPDVRIIDQALTRAFAARQVDARRIALSGFSDGASYALGLGLANGDLFGSVLAFSPGFIPPGGKRAGKPRIFVSHGRNDSVLPIASCSRRLVPELRQAGYAVTYREFDGPHTVPLEIAQEALRWFSAR